MSVQDEYNDIHLRLYCIIIHLRILLEYSFIQV